jgi:hypothetical protein
MTSMWRKIGLAVLAGTPFVLGGCNGADVYFDAPILEAAGINLNVKKNDEEDVPKRAGIVIPPSTDKLPEPGTRTAAAGEQNWPQDPDKLKKNKEEQEAAAHEKYCREGDWSGKAGVTEFNKNIGVEARCPSRLGKAVSKSLGGGSGEEK